ncbi:MAG: glycosyltransferase family 4 protein [candidate division WOR-3 bacterium]|nr:glycosyltransferase family 4 protein [candidate division WOR-3 bacterium]
MKTNRFKICMVSDTYFPYIGGIPEHIYNLSHTLREHGHTVKILTARFSARLVKSLPYLPDEEFVYRIGDALLIRANKSFARLTIGWRLSDKVEKFFEKENFDIIHIHGSLAPTLPILAIRHSSAINVITFHATHPKDKNYLFFRPLLLPYIRKLHGKIAVSSSARDSNMYYFSGECRIIPNGVNIKLYNPSVPRLEKFFDKRPKILFLGRFEPRKGLKYLLQALPIVKKEIPEILLIVVGAGVLGYAYQEYIAKEVKGNIYFAGLIRDEEKPRYYASCDVFCAPSIGYESFGIVLLEAMACGKPIVASDIPGYRTIIEDGKEGFLVQPKCPEEIADRLLKILKNPELAKKMGEQGYKKSLNYSWERVARQVEDYYLELFQQYPYYKRRYAI